MMWERTCKKCGKLFVPAPQHVFVDNGDFYCSWTCFNHRNDNEQKARTSRKIKKVELYSESGCLLKVFINATEAAEITGYSVNRIRAACQNGEKFHGFIWKYRE